MSTTVDTILCSMGEILRLLQTVEKTCQVAIQ